MWKLDKTLPGDMFLVFVCPACGRETGKRIIPERSLEVSIDCPCGDGKTEISILAREWALGAEVGIAPDLETAPVPETKKIRKKV